MDLPAAIKAVTEHRDLSADEMTAVMQTIMTGEATPAQIAGFLVGLRMKGETVDEITAAAAVMRSLAQGVSVQGDHVVDTCGTGGDASGTFNVSTASAFVVAAAGGQVAKHGNRSISSKSGSADVLEAAGVKLDITPDQVANCVRELGVGFMFAPMHHSAMKYAIGPRREMAVRTIFNVLGPLTNPAGAPNQVLGVFSADWVVPLAEVLARLGSHHVMVVHGEDGMDEISVCAPTQVAELQDGKVTTYTISPDQFGMALAQPVDISVDGAEQSLAMIRSVFSGDAGSPRDIVQLNAGAAIYVAGLADDMAAGVNRAGEVIDSGAAAAKLDALVQLTQA
ncbi:MAG TPA: anthranilate phosphoribosyltransferase [Chromatiaceae bacterium]|jgi:anthranilate phosphoribosyltransferase|nr:anthranilate phosphoribosyltransferase [Chromatiaceae bacterium]HIN82247.1 anthranilate phosphoribosyltransferase [Chromatiales bacterium]HIO13579.1 anthranilate phosphoribosyltransferase [Chromatiales bacterium]